MIIENKNLLIVKPLLAKEWHPKKNHPLTSKDVTCGSNKKVWWQCKKDHQWQATINNRSKGKGCPYCSGRYPTLDKSLEKTSPDLVKEWNHEKNLPLTPKDVTPGSTKKLWWKCAKGHQWQATINNRSKGSRCPDCFGMRRYRY